MVLVIKNLPANAGDRRDSGAFDPWSLGQEDPFDPWSLGQEVPFNPWSLGQEDPLEEGMETHSSIVAWGMLWTEGSGNL